MNTTKSKTEQLPTNEWNGASLKRLAIETICAGWLAAAISSTVETLTWDREERLRESLKHYHWSPINDLFSILFLMPFGFVIYSFFHPAGWLFWTGFGSVLWNRSRVFIVIAVAGAIWFGMNWPKHFVAMLGI